MQKIAEKHNAVIAEQTKQATEAAKTAHAAEMTQLQTEWGADYAKNNDIVDKAAESFGMTKEHVGAQTGHGAACGDEVLAQYWI